MTLALNMPRPAVLHAADLAVRDDAMVLAGQSMVHPADDLQAALPVPVLSSPPSCVEAPVRTAGNPDRVARRA